MFLLLLFLRQEKYRIVIVLIKYRLLCVITKYVNVQESDIHGKGIFTTADIPSGKDIMLIKGEVISEEECIRREEDENNVYIFWNEINYIDAKIPK